MDRDEIRKACEEATPGPWEADGSGIWWQEPGWGKSLVADCYEEGEADAAFIAGAREWVPALLAENDELREAVARMECDCLPYAKPGDGQCDRCALLGEV